MLALLVTFQAPSKVRASTMTPSAQSKSDEFVCGAAVTGVAALDSQDGLATTYAISFESLGDREGVVSGIVSMYAGNERFDVPFTGVVAPPYGDRDPKAPPLQVRFQVPVQVSGVYLSEIAGPSGGPCGLDNVFALDPVQLAKPDEELVRRAQGVSSVAASAGVAEAEPSCAIQNAKASLARTVAPDTPESAREMGEAGRVKVRVALTPLGTVAYTNVVGSSGFLDLDAAAVQAARQSRYKPQIFRCIPVGTIFTFNVEFTIR